MPSYHPLTRRAIDARVRTMTTTTRKMTGVVALSFFLTIGFVLFRPVSSEQENARSCTSYVAAVVIPNQYGKTTFGVLALLPCTSRTNDRSH